MICGMARGMRGKNLERKAEKKYEWDVDIQRDGKAVLCAEENNA